MLNAETGFPVRTGCFFILWSVTLFWFICLILLIIVNFLEIQTLEKVLKGTFFSLYACGSLLYSLSIDSPQTIAHIKGLSYLSDYEDGMPEQLGP